MNRTVAVLDIETTAHEQLASWLDPDDLVPPANYKDPLKIEAWRAEKVASLIERGALSCDTGRIVAAAVAAHDGIRSSLARPNDEDEIALLAQVWDALGRQEICGFNIRQFDLPFLLRRSQILEVPAPRLTLDRYRESRIIDLADVLTWRGTVPLRSLRWYCDRFAIYDGASDPVAGADIPALVAADNWDAILAHVTADVERTVALAGRLGVLDPEWHTLLP